MFVKGKTRLLMRLLLSHPRLVAPHSCHRTSIPRLGIASEDKMATTCTRDIGTSALSCDHHSGRTYIIEYVGHVRYTACLTFAELIHAQCLTAYTSAQDVCDSDCADCLTNLTVYHTGQIIFECLVYMYDCST